MYTGPDHQRSAHRCAAANLAQARADAREFGHEQREGIRKRVQEMHAQKDSDDAAVDSKSIAQPGDSAK